MPGHQDVETLIARAMGQRAGSGSTDPALLDVAASDLTAHGDDVLVAGYVANVKRWHAIEHVGAQNRLSVQRGLIVQTLAQRDPTLQALRPLLTHRDAEVCYHAAYEFERCDPAEFGEVMRRLATRQDEIGRLAQQAVGALTGIDSRLSPSTLTHHGDDESPDTGSTLPPSRDDDPLPATFCWQCDAPPSSAMPREEIAQRLSEALPPARASRLMRLALPAIGLWPQRFTGAMSITASRLGGTALAPPDFEWPEVDGEPMLYVGQINCAALRGLPGAELLPQQGVLALFGDHDAVLGCDYFGRDVAVYHWPDPTRLQAVTPPLPPMRIFAPCPLLFRPQIDLPDPSSRAVEDILSDPGDLECYGAVWQAVRHHGIPEAAREHCSHGKLLGWPSLVQEHDLESSPFGIWEPDEPVRLLLQLDDYCNGEVLEGWGPGGSLYFMIADADLRAARFDDCIFDAQFT